MTLEWVVWTAVAAMVVVFLVGVKLLVDSEAEIKRLTHINEAKQYAQRAHANTPIHIWYDADSLTVKLRNECFEDFGRWSTDDPMADLAHMLRSRLKDLGFTDIEIEEVI